MNSNEAAYDVNFNDSNNYVHRVGQNILLKCISGTKKIFNIRISNTLRNIL